MVGGYCSHRLCRGRRPRRPVRTVCTKATVGWRRSMPPAAARREQAPALRRKRGTLCAKVTVGGYCSHRLCRGRRPRRPVRTICTKVTVGGNRSMPPAAARTRNARPYGENGERFAPR
ncbi:MAG: hypothetical protein IJX47_01520 [Clostridia bacterium]|nr:hypothetical protein [Clostridia bacterium]